MKKKAKSCLIHKIRATSLYELKKTDDRFVCVKCGKRWSHASDLPKGWRYH